jgi:hypothetical protein
LASEDEKILLTDETVRAGGRSLDVFPVSAISHNPREQWKSPGSDQKAGYLPNTCRDLGVGASVYNLCYFSGKTFQFQQIYRVFKKERYNFERSYKFIQRTCRVLITVIM